MQSNDSLQTSAIEQIEDSQDEEVYEQFGIDLSRYAKLDFIKEHISDLQDKQNNDYTSLQDQISRLEGALNHMTSELNRQRVDLESQQQVTRTGLIDLVKTLVRDANAPIKIDMENLMTARNRWKSDDMLKQQKVVSRFNVIE